MATRSDRSQGKDASWRDFDDFWEVWEIVIEDQKCELQRLIDAADRRVSQDTRRSRQSADEDRRNDP